MSVKTLQYPPNMQLEVTPVCNENCIHCYNYWRDREAGKTSVSHPDTDYCRIAEKIIENKPTHVVITGGEPMTVFPRIKEAIRMMHEAGIHVSMNTNASLATDEIAAFMKEQGMTAFVSLPSCNEKTCDKITNRENSLDAIAEGIRTLKRNGVRVTVNMVVSKLNFDQVYDTVIYACEELGLDSFFASPVSRPVNADDSFDRLMLDNDDIYHMEKEMLRAKKVYPKLRVEISTSLPSCSFMDKEVSDHFNFVKKCTAGTFSYGIDYEGNVKACPRDSISYGNILEEPFEVIWERMHEWRDDTFLPKECRVCASASVCGGGCRLEAFSKTGGRGSLDPRADLSLLPLKYRKKPVEIIYAEDDVFRVNRNLKRVEDRVGTRISAGPAFLYRTKKLADFLFGHPVFTLDEMAEVFNESSREDAFHIVNFLGGKYILYKEKTT